MKIEVIKIAELKGHNGAIYAIDKGLTEQFIFSGSGDKLIAEWNLKTYESEKIVASFPSVPYSICHISEKQFLLAGSSTGVVHVFDLEKNQEIESLKNHTSEVFNIKYSMATNCLYTAGGDGNLIIYSLDTLSLIKVINRLKLRSLPEMAIFMFLT